MNRVFKILSLVVLIASCGNNKKTKNIIVDNEHKTDSVVFKNPPLDLAIQKMLPLFDETNDLPFLADSSIINHLKKYDSISTNEVKLLSLKKIKHSLSDESNYQLKTFLFIDSIKRAGGYAAYIENLDIGMTKFANAYAIKRVNLDIYTMALIWGINTSTFEACPYANETYIYITIVHKGKVTSSFVLAEDLQAGDPPVSMSRTVNARINRDMTIDIELYEESDEDIDAPKIEINKENYILTLNDGKLIVTNENKEKPKRINRPAN